MPLRGAGIAIDEIGFKRVAGLGFAPGCEQSLHEKLIRPVRRKRDERAAGQARFQLQGGPRTSAAAAHGG